MSHKLSMDHVFSDRKRESLLLVCILVLIKGVCSWLCMYVCV